MIIELANRIGYSATRLVGYSVGLGYSNWTDASLLYLALLLGLGCSAWILYCGCFAISLGQFRVGSHQLRVEAEHLIPWEGRLCQICHRHETKTEEHFIFICPHYYEIRGRFHCLFRESRNSLATFFRCPDQPGVVLGIGSQAQISHPTAPHSTRNY